MKQVSILVCVVFLLLCSAGAEVSAPKPDPAFLEIEQNLRAALAGIEPAVSFEYPDTKLLMVRYQTRKFMIHHGSMIGKFSEKASEEEGPSYKGFMLWVSLQKAGTVNQAVVPQTIRRPYWRTDLGVTVVENTDKQLYWGLSYGSNVDQELLTKIKITLNALDQEE